MSDLADRLVRLADRVYLAEQWANRGDAQEASEHLAGVHAELVALAEEVDR